MTGADLEPHGIGTSMVPSVRSALPGVTAARLLDGRLVDIAFADGTVAEVREAGSAALPGAFDLDGRLLLPAPAEPHTHLDKALSFDVIRPTYGGLAEGIAQWQAHARGLDEDDFVIRARTAALEFVANGVTAIRTHAEIFPSVDPLVSVRAMLRVRAELAALMDIQIVVLAKNDIADSIVADAIDLGADLVGGSPHNAADPGADLERLLAIARTKGVGIDIHADERLDPRSLTVLALAESVRLDPLDGTVTAGHCVSLGVLEPEAQAEAARVIASAGIGVVTLPLTNLFLQGRDHPAATPRGLTAVRPLLDAGVVLAAGGDNVRDTLNPVGAADALATAELLVAAAHVTIEEALTAVTDSARQVMGLPPAGAFPGAAADFLAVRAPSAGDAMSLLQHDRVVIHAGRLVARRTSHLELAPS